MSKIKNFVNTLKRKKIKISCAESCTGGLLASSITSINGASKVFVLGLVTYSNQAKIKILKVDKNIIKNMVRLVISVASQWLIIYQKFQMQISIYQLPE